MRLTGSLTSGPVAGAAIDAASWAPEHELAAGLHLVATPIGNLGDMTLRGLWVLRNVDRILCEDTRVTARLLSRFGIDTPLDPYHDHNADRVRPAVLEMLRRGERVALVSDAGTPLVSDPGFKLVRAALAENLPVTAAPGPSAALTAPKFALMPRPRTLRTRPVPALACTREFPCCSDFEGVRCLPRSPQREPYGTDRCVGERKHDIARHDFHHAVGRIVIGAVLPVLRRP